MREEEIIISDDFVEALAKHHGIDVSTPEKLKSARDFMNEIAGFCAELCESQKDADNIHNAFIDPANL